MLDSYSGLSCKLTKQSTQLNFELQGPSGRQPGLFLEQFTRVGNLRELAQLQRLPARVCAREDSENSLSRKAVEVA